MVGNGVFKTYKYNEGTLKANPIQKIEPQNFLCHSWLSEDRIIVGTDTGKMLLFEGQEHKKDFHVSSPVAADSSGGERYRLTFKYTTFLNKAHIYSLIRNSFKKYS